jgi:hypothetical protein
MIHRVPIARLLFLAVALLNLAATPYAPRDGDVVFHVSQTSQSRAIQLATGSRYSHVGIVFVEEGQPVVWEAVGPVKRTPLAEWIARGQDGHHVVKRLVDADAVLTEEAVTRLRQAVLAFAGRPYDFLFSWADEAIYCSELVWKAYQRGLGIELGTLQRLGDFDLSHPHVRAKMVERYGESVPVDTPVISPAAVFDSPRLRTVGP